MPAAPNNCPASVATRIAVSLAWHLAIAASRANSGPVTPSSTACSGASERSQIESPCRRSKLFLPERHTSMTIDEAARTDLYKKGLARIVSDTTILSGEPGVRGTRLAVRHVGGMRLNGEPTERIIEAYPDLSAEDVEFAVLYAAANPTVGRARTNIKR